MRIGLTFNVKTEFPLKPEDPPDANAEFDHPDTIAVIEQAFREGGHEVVRIGGARQLLEAPEKARAMDMIFNIAEGYGGRNRESQVPILLDMWGIPFVGADGLSQGITLDKIIAKKLLIAEGIPTPKFFELADTKDTWRVELSYPMIVKPRCEGSSKGLRKNSLVKNVDELTRQAQWIIETYKQSALVEEFIEGTEFTVGIIGNDPPEAQPVVQIKLDGHMDLGRLFYTWEHLRSGADYICPAPISEELRRRLQEVSLRTFRAVECRDFGRVDIRVDRAGHPYVLEINPLPSLSTEDAFTFMAKAQGLTYNQIVNRILDAALVRHGVKAKEEVISTSAIRSHSRTT